MCVEGAEDVEDVEDDVGNDVGNEKDGVESVEKDYGTLSPYTVLHALRV